MIFNGGVTIGFAGVKPIQILVSLFGTREHVRKAIDEVIRADER
jgi:hypothetical protein